jgi:4-amino-4-deoxy-L-arabinose transferase-like glycosyltransferase
VSTTSPSPDVSDGPVGSRRGRRLEPALVALLALTLNLAGNGRVSLWDRDEPRYTQCVREMRARGDWINPSFNAEPRYHKPILIYWLMRAGFALGGDNPFGARLVSALAGVATCLVTWELGRRMLGPRAGRLGALMLATAPIMVTESKLATTDATLTLWLVGGQCCLWELARRPSAGFAAGFWGLMALAFLTKGPVGPALIAVAGLVSWWWGGPTACWRRLRWRWGPLLFLLLTAPWFVAVGLISHGEFFRFALGNQVINRVASGMEEHGAFPGYYILTSLGMFHPWSAFVPAALLAAWTRRGTQPAFGFLLGWVVGPLILLECVRTKLVHYYLPAYPACALLAAWLVLEVVKDEVNLRRYPLGRLAFGLLGGVGIGASVALIALAMVVPAHVRWPSLVLAVLMGAGTIVAMGRIYHGATERAATGLAASWAVILLVMGAWLLPSLEPYRTPRIVGERLAALSRTLRAQPVLLTFQEPSVIYAVGHPVPTTKTWPQFDEQLRIHGAVITPLLPHELAEFHRRPWLEAEVKETLTGFNLNKGQTQTLRFTLVRARRSTPSAPPAIAHRASGAAPSSSRGGTDARTDAGPPGPSPGAAPGRPPAGGSRR